MEALSPGKTQVLYFKDFIYLFLERGREGKREGEEHQCVIASHAPSTGDLAGNPGMYPAWESNQQPIHPATPARAEDPAFGWFSSSQPCVAQGDVSCSQAPTGELLVLHHQFGVFFAALFLSPGNCPDFSRNCYTLRIIILFNLSVCFRAGWFSGSLPLYR